MFDYDFQKVALHSTFVGGYYSSWSHIINYTILVLSISTMMLINVYHYYSRQFVRKKIIMMSGA